MLRFVSLSHITMKTDLTKLPTASQLHAAAALRHSPCYTGRPPQPRLVSPHIRYISDHRCAEQTRLHPVTRMEERTVTLLDYGAGNVRSIRNAITRLGWSIVDVQQPSDISAARRLIFPGVGSFAAAMQHLANKGYLEPLKAFILSGRPFFGICIGMQALFDWSEEGDAAGIGIIPGRVERFRHSLAIPHIGWNSLAPFSQREPASPLFSSSSLLPSAPSSQYYFVHSYRVLPSSGCAPYILAVTDYGERFVSAVQRGHLLATQFHPEKSSKAGLELIERFLLSALSATDDSIEQARQLLQRRDGQAEAADVTIALEAEEQKAFLPQTELSKRIIACLDVRENDDGDLVVTKGDQYDVREAAPASVSVSASQPARKGQVRNLGKPVDLARRYYEEGADEITFLNITSFRAEPVADLPLLAVLREASQSVFVPLCVGGGIRDYVDADGAVVSSLRVADEYFRSGADKISIGSDAVLAAERWWQSGCKADGSSSIEQISHVYGAQAVVVSIDPRRVYVPSPASTRHACISTNRPGPGGELHCWYQCTIKGGREGRDVDVVQLVQAVQALGAGELLVNCVDCDGQRAGYDLELMRLVESVTTLPVIASSGAGRVEHFSQVFNETGVQAALAAGIFHRREVPIEQVKQHMRQSHIPTRL